MMRADRLVVDPTRTTTLGLCRISRSSGLVVAHVDSDADVRQPRLPTRVCDLLGTADIAAFRLAKEPCGEPVALEMLWPWGFRFAMLGISWPGQGVVATFPGRNPLIGVNRY